MTIDVVHQIQDVIKSMVVPSWVSSVPAHFGESVTGTLKADEWRTLATIYLPIALMICWGRVAPGSGAAMSQHLQGVLDHTMLLVSAIHLASRRTTTRTVARKYKQYMTQYMRDLETIHPHARYTPNLHASVHIADFIEQFGPVHSWWTFPFERLIGQLQNIQTNHKFGMYTDSLAVMILTLPRTNRSHCNQIIFQGSKALSLACKS